MTGAFESIIGVRREEVLQRFLTQLPTKFEVAKKDIRLHGAVVRVDELSGKALGIERIAVACG